MIEASQLHWDKANGLVPAIVQDGGSGAVLMLGYMNAEALQVTQETGKVTFFSRSKQRLWTKGETSGHYLELVSIAADCDNDTLLVLAIPHGPVCHLDTQTCWGNDAPTPRALEFGFLADLERVLDERIAARSDNSYTMRLLNEGPRRVAQKLGEEGVELALAAAAGSRAEIVSEAADLVYHLLVLLKSKGLNLANVAAELATRHAKRG